MRVTPDMQTGPAGYFLAWGLIVVIVVGVIFASGAGGAIAWALMWLVVFVLAYFLWKRFIRWLV